MSRIPGVFETLNKQKRAAFIPFIMAGDPDLETSSKILQGLPAAGADIIELGVAFTDPMADGPSIQAAGIRALNAGQTLVKTLDMVSQFRTQNNETPIVLMGYLNPLHRYGFEKFAVDAEAAGVDGLIVVDAPPEEDETLQKAAASVGIDLIKLATPTTDNNRLKTVVRRASGFLYYVSIAGVTGTASASKERVKTDLERLKAHVTLPIAVGFGIKTPSQAAETASFADAVVVGSALVDRIAQQDSNSDENSGDTLKGLEAQGRQSNIKISNLENNDIVSDTLAFARELAEAVHRAD
ncbi:MAG: tryptophan synthase subunit alpha [Pseudomonadota bacterium]